MTDVITFEQVLQDRKMRIETFLNVINKENELVPFNLNHIQDLQLSTQSERKRDLELKPAQVGSTTLWVGDFLLDTMNARNRTSIIVAYDEQLASRLLLKAKQLYRDLVRDINGRSVYWPELGRDSTTEMFFPELGSTLFIASAGSRNFGRGEPFHNVLFSEAAFYKDAVSMLNAMGDRISMRTGQIIIESTPNGQEGDGEFFYRMYKLGKTDPDAPYVSHFYSWWFHDEYRIPEGSIYALTNDRYNFDYTDEEQLLVDRHGLDIEQIRWRRKKIAEKSLSYSLGQDRELFGQEFPENDEECFLTTGDQAYDSYTLEQLYRKCYIPDKSFDGAMVWFEPEQGHLYDVTIDPSLGTGRVGNSKTVLHVWEFGEHENGEEWGKLCARLSGNFTAGVASQKALSLAAHWNNARIIPETNPPGIPIAYALVNANYPNVYYRENIINGKPTREIGWLTTPRTKPFMCEQLAYMLPKLEVYDSEFVAQCRNMRYEGDRVVAHGPDDHHDAGAIAMACRRSRRAQSLGYTGHTRSGGW